MKNKTIINLVAFMRISLVCRSQNFTVDSLDLQINQFANYNALSGFAVAMVNMDGVIYENSFGYADMENKTAYIQ